jgi:hypothetical protein
MGVGVDFDYFPMGVGNPHLMRSQNDHPIHLAYQPPGRGTFLLEQISHQLPARSTFLSEQISTNNQPPAKRHGGKFPLGDGAPWGMPPMESGPGPKNPPRVGLSGRGRGAILPRGASRGSEIVKLFFISL